MIGWYDRPPAARDRRVTNLTLPPAPGYEFTLAGETRAKASERPVAELANQLAKLIYDKAGGGLSSTASGGMTPTEQVNNLTGYVYVCVSRIRNAVAQTPLKVWGPGSGGDDVEITDPAHPLVMLLGAGVGAGPNVLDTRFEFWSQTITFLKLTGTAYWLKVFEPSGGLAELWWLPSQFLRPKHDKGQALVGYEWTNGSGVVIPRDHVVCFRNPSPASRFEGMSDLAAAAAAVKSQNAIKSAQLQAFNNDILSSLFFTTEELLGEDDWKRMLAFLVERYSGPQRAGTPVLLYGGVKPANVSRPPQEMGFRDSAAITRDEVLAIYGVPPIVAGIVENANYSNSLTQERLFAQYTIRPLLVQIQERINKDLAPLLGDGSYVEFDDPVPQDPQVETQIDSRRLAGDVVLVNELREKLGLPPVPWGNEPRWLNQARLQAQLYAGPPSKPAAEPPAPQPDPPGGVDDDEPPGEKSHRPAAPARRVSVQGAALRKLAARTARQDYARLEAQTVPMLRKYFARQAERIKANVERLYGDLPERRLVAIHRRVVTVPAEFWYGQTAEGDWCRVYRDGTVAVELGDSQLGRAGRLLPWGEVKLSRVRRCGIDVRALSPDDADDLDDWLKAAEDLAIKMLPRIEDALRSGGQMQLDALDLDDTFSLSNPAVGAWLRGKERDYWLGTVEETTKQLLSERLAAVLEDEPTLPKLMEAVEEVMGHRIQSSAENIARTETVGAYNAGGDIVRDDSGVEAKEWLATADERTREAHLDADGQVVPQDEDFTVDGEQLSYPGDPRGSPANICQCRCTAAAFFD